MQKMSAKYRFRKGQLLTLFLLSGIILLYGSSNTFAACTASCPNCESVSNCTESPEALTAQPPYNGPLCTGGKYTCKKDKAATLTVDCSISSAATGTTFQGKGSFNVCQLQPFCGNGVQETGEECDEGKKNGVDCTSACTIVAPTCAVGDSPATCASNQFTIAYDKFNPLNQATTIHCNHCEKPTDPQYPCTKANLGPRATGPADNSACLGECTPKSPSTVDWGFTPQAPTGNVLNVGTPVPPTGVVICSHREQVVENAYAFTECALPTKDGCTATKKKLDPTLVNYINCSDGTPLTSTFDCNSSPPSICTA